MSDIVERLREFSEKFPPGRYAEFVIKRDFSNEAADEIERLQGELDRLLNLDTQKEIERKRDGFRAPTIIEDAINKAKEA